ncbi:hypothetical protein EMIHUDRAFT_458801, partial [Emiliania huxleyi CCMP1516]|uniref:Heterokaryon incompatibility domain-containing protein n=2 Tax=Emiliania huxleyi TaxID=2903 RepID=A0A0D3J6M0_EMIH1
MAVAWACEIADFYALSRIPLPLYGIPAALGPALVLLACRPLDHIGVRLAGAFCCASYLYYVRPHHTHMTFIIDILDCIESDWPAAAASGWAPLETVLLSLQLFGIFFASLGSAIGFFAASLSRATRDALRRQWVVLRTSYALGAASWGTQRATTCAASWGTQYLVLLAVGRPVSPYLALSCYCDGFGTLLFTLFFTERVRGRIHRSLGLGWNGKPETCRSLAAVASLIGSGAATSVIERRCRDAISSFRGVPWTSLTAGDLAAEWDGELEARRQEDHTVPAALGEVDAFLSHSWSDDGREKYEALCGWADAFEAAYGRPPLLWLDRCCIRQDDDIAASLLGLPIFLSGCRSLLVLYGPSYCGRLCVMEVFCFLAMGGKPDDIH